MSPARPWATNKITLCRLACIAALSLLSNSINGYGNAADINGAWTTDVAACKKIFVNKGNRISLTSDADLYGSGFVVDGTMICGKIATCKITSLKEDGSTLHLNAACATDIMMSSNQFDLKMVDNNKLVRAFPGIPEMDTPYYRCPAD